MEVQAVEVRVVVELMVVVDWALAGTEEVAMVSKEAEVETEEVMRVVEVSVAVAGVVVAQVAEAQVVVGWAAEAVALKEVVEMVVAALAVVALAAEVMEGEVKAAVVQAVAAVALEEAVRKARCHQQTSGCGQRRCQFHRK